MQIVVNTRLLLRNRLDGIGGFTHNTLQRITRKNPTVHFVFLFDRPFDESFVYSSNVTPLIIGPQARHPLLYYAWFQHSVKSVLRRMKPDLFLSPDGFLSLGAGCRQQPVIHDINFHHHPKDNKWLTAKYYNYYFPRFARAATRIATVSEYSRQDIARNYQVDPGKIDVVFNGINSFFRPLDQFTIQATRNRFSYGKPYFLFVGSLHPRKNLVRLIRAFNLFRQESGADYKLLLAGPGFWGMRDIHGAIESSPVKSDIVCTERLNDEDLALVMGSAAALTFVPYYEGFGIPLIEAMQAGIPIISGNLTSLPEIAGDAALLVNPHSEEEIKNAMLKIQRDVALCADLVAKGFVRKENFSWDKTASLLWQSVNRAVGGK